MVLELATLILEPKPDASRKFIDALRVLAAPMSFQVARTPREALELMSLQSFDVCFVSSELPLEDRNALFRDFSTQFQGETVFFVQVREVVESEASRVELSGARFATVVSRCISESDQAALQAVLASAAVHRGSTERTEYNERMVDLVLLEVDRVARDLKRGKFRRMCRAAFGPLLRDFMDFSPAVQHAYWAYLEQKTADAQPASDRVPQLPSHMFERSLPGLSNGTYEGQSLRVWDMLVEKFGVLDPLSARLSGDSRK